MPCSLGCDARLTVTDATALRRVPAPAESTSVRGPRTRGMRRNLRPPGGPSMPHRRTAAIGSAHRWAQPRRALMRAIVGGQCASPPGAPLGRRFHSPANGPHPRRGPAASANRGDRCDESPGRRRHQTATGFVPRREPALSARTEVAAQGGCRATADAAVRPLRKRGVQPRAPAASADTRSAAVPPRAGKRASRHAVPAASADCGDRCAEPLGGRW